MSDINEHQKFEREWWGTCRNTYGEETKQMVYARLMGLSFSHDGNSPFSIDMAGKSVLDIGGGPVSLLLKCRNVKGAVVDPCEYPEWVKERYKAAGIQYIRAQGEDVSAMLSEHLARDYDEVWIYNVLQHTDDPEKIIRSALEAGRLLRIFEWIDIPPHEGHPHMLTEENLNKWIGKKGFTGALGGEGECYGKYYAGLFKNG